MTDPDLWARIEAQPLRTAEGQDLAAALAVESSLLPDQIAPTLAEYRRWRYLRSLDPGLVSPPIMPWI
ncbi:hypothetical protein [Stagnihabitans tardus]|uniref:Uncharacterized protein n=1 Tax=Stagnihabitans tardus TaxID=2699202 RepID=A0AAE5BVY2_9RHOB|nr:hypothetical protein [Stagnihabitans tardus]NBZ87738.1 hypothetical protein [Stagnihabitans tardus]